MPTLTIRIKIDPNDRDHDIVTLQNGDRYHFSTWLRNVDLAVRTVRTALDSHGDALTASTINAAKRGRMFLLECGVKTQDDFERLEYDLLPKLKMPPDSPRASRRCLVCGHHIWGRVSLLTGIGTECRRGSPRRTRVVPLLIQAVPA